MEKLNKNKTEFEENKIDFIGPYPSHCSTSQLLDY